MASLADTLDRYFPFSIVGGLYRLEVTEGQGWRRMEWRKDGRVEGTVQAEQRMGVRNLAAWPRLFPALARDSSAGSKRFEEQRENASSDDLS